MGIDCGRILNIPDRLVHANATSILPGGMAAVDLETLELLRVSPGLAALTGYACPEALCSASGDSLRGLFTDTDRPCVRASLEHMLQADSRAKVECRLVCREGPPIWVTLCAGLVRSAEWGVYLECFFLDLTDLKRTEAELAARCRILMEKNRRESMTGLLNKEAFRDDVKRYLSSVGEKSAYALLVIDLDDFKCINDRFGHTFGDQVLQSFSSILKNSFGPNALCGRYGGDEFVVFLQDTPLALVASALKEFYRLLHCRRKEDLPFQCSTGAACGTGCVNYGLLFDRADTALYEAKHMGKNRYVVVASR